MIRDWWKRNQVMHRDQGLVENEFSGEGFDRQEEHQGWTPMGTRFPPPVPSLDRGL